MVDEEEFDSLIAVLFVLDGVFLENPFNIILFIGKTNNINFLVLSFELVSDSVDILHGVVRFRVNILKLILHNDCSAFFVSIDFPKNNIISPASKFNSVDVVNYRVNFVEFDIQVHIIVYKL